MEEGIHMKRFRLLSPSRPEFFSLIKYLLIFSLYLNFQVFPGNSIADDWPYWRGPNRNGISDEKGWNPRALEGGAKILWETNVGNGYSAVSVKDGYLYTMGNLDNKDIVYCLEEETGEEVWRFVYDCWVRSYPGAFATPVVDGNHVYTVSRKGDVHCLDSRTGKKKWAVDITEEFGAPSPKYGFSGSPVIEGDGLILNGCKHGIALNKHTGRKIWASPPGRSGYATPVIHTYKGKRCAVIFSHRCLNCVDLTTGELLWYFPWVFDDGADSADPAVVGSRVFISTAYRNGATVIDFSGKEPKQLWFKKDIQDEFGSSIYLDGYLYVPHGDTRHRTAYLKCIDFDTGEELWTRDTGHCSLIYVDGKFIVLNQWGELLIMEASEKGYKDLSKAKVVDTSRNVRCWTAPVLANGKIYVRTNTGELVCVDVSLPVTSND